MAVLEGQDFDAEPVEQLADRSRHARIAGPEIAGLRLAHEKAAGEIRIGRAEGRGEAHRLMRQPPGLADEEDVEIRPFRRFARHDGPGQVQRPLKSKAKS